MTHTQLDVELGDRSYPIFIGTGTAQNTDLITPYLASRQVMIVTNTEVGPRYLEQLRASLRSSDASLQIDEVVLPDGEQHKNLTTLNRIFDGLLSARHNRKTTLLALGGGVIGDMCGFAAATYQRGVGFIQVPTTLLSQVDSSVGGKTGVNHPLGKNMIGAFHQPRAVVIDTHTLTTLAERELSAGLAEVIKYGLIADSEFFAWLESNMTRLMARDDEALREAIVRSCQTKARVVAQDETEAGVRAILNLGHTYGHAIETQMGYGQWLHGEAVAVGMVMACELSVELGWLPVSVLHRARELLQNAALPVTPPASMSAQDFLTHMQVDKKNLDGQIRLVLLQALGSAVVTSDFDPQTFQSLLAHQCGGG